MHVALHDGFSARLAQVHVLLETAHSSISFSKKKKIFCDYAGLAKMLCQNLYLTQYSSQVKKENTDRNNDIIMKLYEILTHTNCNNVAVMFW